MVCWQSTRKLPGSCRPRFVAQESSWEAAPLVFSCLVRLPAPLLNPDARLGHLITPPTPFLQLLELQSQWQAQQQALQDARARLVRRDADVAPAQQAAAGQLPDVAASARLQALEEAQKRWEAELGAVRQQAAEQARRQWEGRLVLVQREAEQEAMAVVRRRTQELERDREQAVGQLRLQLEQQAQVCVFRFGVQVQVFLLG